MKNIEVEIQVNVENIKPLLQFLKKKAKFLSQEREIDQYYSPTHRNFTAKNPVSEWLRLRETKGKYTINYKHWHRDQDGKTNHCDEYQSGITDIEQMKNILKVLDFQPMVLVDKIRKKYLFEHYEICIDQVKGLEEAVEIEYKGEADQTPTEITKEMVRFLRDLGVGKIKRTYQGYAYLLLKLENAVFEEIG